MGASQRGKWDTLVANGVLTADELALATRVARKRFLDVQTVLDEDFQLDPRLLGEALAQFYAVPYEPFRPDRERPVHLLRNIGRHFAQTNGWVALDQTSNGLLILATDPERTAASGTVNSIYPGAKALYRVCTEREFIMTLDQLFGPISLD